MDIGAGERCECGQSTKRGSDWAKWQEMFRGSRGGAGEWGVGGVEEVVVMIKLGMSYPAFVFGTKWRQRNGERELMNKRRDKEEEEERSLYGSNMKTSTAVYKDSGIDTNHTSRLRTFVTSSSLVLGGLHLFVSLVLVFFVSGGQGLPFS